MNIILLLVLLSMTFASAFINRAFKRGVLTRLPVRMSSNSNSGKFILEYSYVPDILDKRTPYRAEHLALAEALAKDGIIVAAGPFTPPTGAVFLFHTHDKDIIKKFVDNDPYVKAKLVTDYKIKEWNVVIGGLHSKL